MKSKHKGSWFERYVCKKLHKLTGLDFVRVPLSGASWLKGDVICLQAKEIRIEVKYRKKLRLREFEKFVRLYPEDVVLVCGIPWFCKVPNMKGTVGLNEVAEFIRSKVGCLEV